MCEPNIQIAITHWYGSSEWCHAKDDGTLIQCAVIGCHEQVLFRNPEAEDWVCFLHGQLTLRQQWDKWGPMFLTAIIDRPENASKMQLNQKGGQ